MAAPSGNGDTALAGILTEGDLRPRSTEAPVPKELSAWRVEKELINREGVVHHQHSFVRSKPDAVRELQPVVDGTPISARVDKPDVFGGWVGEIDLPLCRIRSDTVRENCLAKVYFASQIRLDDGLQNCHRAAPGFLTSENREETGDMRPTGVVRSKDLNGMTLKELRAVLRECGPLAHSDTATIIQQEINRRSEIFEHRSKVVSAIIAIMGAGLADRRPRLEHSGGNVSRDSGVIIRPDTEATHWVWSGQRSERSASKEAASRVAGNRRSGLTTLKR